MIEQEIEISLTDNLVPAVVHVKQFDHLGRQIRCRIYERSILFTLPKNTIVNVTGTKPDGNVFQYSSETDAEIVRITDGCVMIKVTDVMSAVFGRVPVDVTLMNQEEETVGNFSFLLRVEHAALNHPQLTRASYSGTLKSVADHMADCSITDDGYLCIESDDGLGLTFSMDEEGVLSIEYGRKQK